MWLRMFSAADLPDHGDMTTEEMESPVRVLRRRYEGHIVAGVASGIAEYLDIDVSIVRLGLVVLSLMGGMGVPLYAAAWLFIPEESSDVSIAAHLLHDHAPETSDQRA